MTAARRLIRSAAAAALTVLAIAGCARAAGANSPSAGKAGGPTITIKLATIRGEGQVLVTSRGYALYMFQPDQQREVTCAGLCAATWPRVVPDARGRATSLSSPA